jgi:glutamyl/glutaminyl-tRNA synthetase
MPIIKERIHTFEEVRTLINEGEFTYFIEEPVYQKESLYFPNSKLEDTQKEEVTKKVLTELIRIISSLETIDRDTVKNALWDYASEIGRGDVLWPLRYALSGKEKSPDPFVLVEVLGKEKALQRINFAESLFT